MSSGAETLMLGRVPKSVPQTSSTASQAVSR